MPDYENILTSTKKHLKVLTLCQTEEMEPRIHEPMNNRGRALTYIAENDNENIGTVDKIETDSTDSTIMRNLPEPERVIKHPLEHTWTMWFFKNDKSKAWEKNQKQISSVSTVEDFWALIHTIVGPSKLKHGCDYSFFKKGIFPDWEDVRNAPGGRWMINVDRKQREELDNYWREILMFLVGEQAGPHAHQVNGASVTVRPRVDKLAIWLADASQPDCITMVAKMIKETLDIVSTIGFLNHSEEKAGYPNKASWVM